MAVTVFGANPAGAAAAAALAQSPSVSPHPCNSHHDAVQGCIAWLVHWCQDPAAPGGSVDADDVPLLQERQGAELKAGGGVEGSGYTW